LEQGGRKTGGCATHLIFSSLLLFFDLIIVADKIGA